MRDLEAGPWRGHFIGASDLETSAENSEQMRAVKFNPLTFFVGKSATAVNMARHYSAACLNLDSVVLEAISDSSTNKRHPRPGACIRAAIEQSMKEEESGESHFSDSLWPTGPNPIGDAQFNSPPWAFLPQLQKADL